MPCKMMPRSQGKLIRTGIFIILVALPACASGQKITQWELDNLMIGPDSPIQIPAGSSFTVQLMVPIADAPPQPSKAPVRWSLVPATQGITIGETSGQITVAASVPHGTVVKVHA